MNQEIKNKFGSYPSDARKKLEKIRELIFNLAVEESLGEITEQLKWGEPSYSSKFGSPIRIDWKPKHPDQVSLFVNCKTVLIETYREVYGSALQYIGNREVVIPLAEPTPLPELKGCILMALKYHKLKKLPLLGV